MTPCSSYENGNAQEIIKFIADAKKIPRQAESLMENCTVHTPYLLWLGNVLWRLGRNQATSVNLEENKTYVVGEAGCPQLSGSAWTSASMPVLSQAIIRESS